MQVQIELFESESTLGATFVAEMSLVASALSSAFKYPSHEKKYDSSRLLFTSLSSVVGCVGEPQILLFFMNYSTRLGNSTTYSFSVYTIRKTTISKVWKLHDRVTWYLWRRFFSLFWLAI